MKPLNYYMSEVEAPPEVEEAILALKPNTHLLLIQELALAIGRGGWYSFNPYEQFEVFYGWIAKQSPETYKGLIRWLAMEVI